MYICCYIAVFWMSPAQEVLCRQGHLSRFHAHAHDDIIKWNKWKRFPRYWSFVRGIDRSANYVAHKGQWGRALMFYLICAWTSGRANAQHAGDLTRHRDDYYDVTVNGDIQSIITVAPSLPVWNRDTQLRAAWWAAVYWWQIQSDNACEFIESSLLHNMVINPGPLFH